MTVTHPFDLTGQTAVVTGGNSGIGLGIAKGLAAAGADVCIWGRNAEKNDAACDEVNAAGAGTTIALQCDVSDEQAVKDAVAETIDQLGHIESVFANAGVAGIAPSFAQMTTEEWHRVLKVNLDGVFFTLRAAAEHMQGHGHGGSLVVTSSLAAYEGQARGQHYAASKGAIISMIKAIAVEYARYDIRANAIIPGWIESEMTENLFQIEKFADNVMKRIPVRRWGTGEDFAGIAVYLASKASRYHTGDTMIIDGGYSIF